MLEAAGAQHGSHEPPLAPRCGPDRDEWQAHKGRIEILYCERQLPLKDVMKIMQKEHDFHGTYVFSIAGVPLSARPHLLTKFTYCQHSYVQGSLEAVGFSQEPEKVRDVDCVG
jgi:hypothetical protein